MKQFFTILLLAFAITSQAQIHVGSNEVPNMNSAGKIAPVQLNDFKKSTTVFTLQVRDYEQQQAFQEAIASVWKVTPFKIIEPNEIEKYAEEGYSIFSFGAVSVQNRSGSYTHFTYDVWMAERKGKGRIKQHYLARIWLSPSGKVLHRDRRSAGGTSKVYSRDMLPYIYQEADFYNWSPGMLKGYLKEVNDALEKGQEQGPYSSHTDEVNLKKLKNDTLYIPDYVFLNFNAFSGAEKMELPDEEELRKEYPYAFKILTAKDLDKLILSGKPIKYLVYVKSSSSKFVNVYDAQTGKMLYGRYIKMSYNFKPKDLKQLAKEIN